MSDTSKKINEIRHLVTKSKRVVIKLGTRVLVDESGKPNPKRIADLARDIAKLRKQKKQVILVSSGAIGAGMHALGMKRRPHTLPDLQMTASVGQTRLMELYQRYFHKHDLLVSQVLLTHEDLRHRTRHLNARNTITALLRRGVIPIVNENDVVAVDEIQVGDNDILSSLVTVLSDADLLILLTTPNGIQKTDDRTKTMTRIPMLESISPSTFSLVHKKTSSLSTGGMTTKLKAAQTANKIGSLAVIASGHQPSIINKIMTGDDVGTVIGNPDKDCIKRSRKQWIAFFHRIKGQIIINPCAVKVLTEDGRSLLPIGIVDVNNNFPIGSVVEIIDEKNNIIGRGLVDYNSDDIQKIKGKKTTEIASILGNKNYDAVIHRDNLVIDSL